MSLSILLFIRAEKINSERITKATPIWIRVLDDQGAGELRNGIIEHLKELYDDEEEFTLKQHLEGAKGQLCMNTYIHTLLVSSLYPSSYLPFLPVYAYVCVLYPDHSYWYICWGISPTNETMWHSTGQVGCVGHLPSINQPVPCWADGGKILSYVDYYVLYS